MRGPLGSRKEKGKGKGGWKKRESWEMRGWGEKGQKLRKKWEGRKRKGDLAPRSQNPRFATASEYGVLSLVAQRNASRSAYGDDDA